MTDVETVDDGPKLTSNLIGHTAAETQLLELWNAGRMPHAVMLTGRPGIGKATLGYRLACFVLASGSAQTGGGLFEDAGPTTLYVAPESPTFRRVAAGGHVDMMVLERPWDEKKGKRRGVIPMDMAQKAVSFLRLTSGEGGWRVVLVDAVDDLNVSSANALLKVLEEPPPQVLLILLANAPGRVLPTIRSRCRQLPLAPLSEAETLAVVSAKTPDVSPEERALAVALAEGSPGQALALLEQGAAVIYGAYMDLMAALPDYPFAKAQAFADAVGIGTDDGPFAAFCDVFNGWLARMLRGAVEEGGGAIADEPRINARLYAPGNLDPWFEVWDKAGAWFAETNGLNLDRKQAVLAVIDACAVACRHSTSVSAPVGAA